MRSIKGLTLVLAFLSSTVFGGENLVAETGLKPYFPAPPAIFGRTLWVHPHGSGLLDRNELVEVMKEEMMKPRFGLEPPLESLMESDPVTGGNKVTTKALYSLKTEPGRPFMLRGGASRPPFECFNDFTVDKTGYAEWKKAHPEFLGFRISEWDNDFSGLLWGEKKNDLGKRLSRCKVSKLAAENIEKLLSGLARENALDKMKAYYDRIAEFYFNDREKIISLDCCRALSHYAMEWGCGFCMIETTGSSYQRHQIQMYFIRGASRQYGNRPWGWYIALCMNNLKGFGTTEPVYMGRSELGKAGGNGGMSPSVNLRDRFLAWYAGAGAVISENWRTIYCQDADTNGIWELSPHGEALREWYDFTLKNPERGVSYAPVAIGVQWDHLFCPIQGGAPAGGVFLAEQGDRMTDALMRTLVPYRMDRFFSDEQSWALAETPYGDIYDVLLPDLPSGPLGMDVLKNYRVFFLSGSFDPDEKLAARLKEYVAGGGTLIINASQLGKYLGSEFTGVKITGECGETGEDILYPDGTKSFSMNPGKYDFWKAALSGGRALLLDAKGNLMAAANRYGRGNVILTTPCYLVPKGAKMNGPDLFAEWGQSHFPFLDWIFGKVSEEVLPFTVKGTIQYGVNLLDNGLLIYLINNHGVLKNSRDPQKLDPAKTARVELDLRELKIAGIRELRTGEALAAGAKNTVEISVPPGNVRVVEITFAR